MTKAAVLVAMIAVVSGLIQGITGLGGGMLLMLVLPLFFTVQVSSAVAGAICLFLTAAMVIRYRKKVNFKLAVLPALLYGSLRNRNPFLGRLEFPDYQKVTGCIPDSAGAVFPSDSAEGKNKARADDEHRFHHHLRRVRRPFQYRKPADGPVFSQQNRRQGRVSRNATNAVLYDAPV